jgi:Spy/CpxP family protein refolding chaperone
MKKKLTIILLIAGFSAGIILGLSIPRLWKKGIQPRPGPNHFLANYLSLSESQRKKVESLNGAFYPRITEIRAQLAQERAELSDLLGESPPNQEKIEVKINEIASLQVQLEREVINHLVEMQKILTPEQRNKFLSFTKRRLHPGRQKLKKIR